MTPMRTVSFAPNILVEASAVIPLAIMKLRRSSICGEPSNPFSRRSFSPRSYQFTVRRAESSRLYSHRHVPGVCQEHARLLDCGAVKSSSRARMRSSHVTHTFSPLYPLGTTVDRAPSNATDMFFRPDQVKQVLSAGCWSGQLPAKYRVVRPSHFGRQRMAHRMSCRALVAVLRENKVHGRLEKCP